MFNLRLRSRFSRSTFSLFASVAIVFAACNPKVAQISYLSPLDRTQEGFLDRATYQIITFGNALDFSKPVDARKTLLPTSINELFDQEALLSYNAKQQALLNERKPVVGVTLADILASEVNQLNPQEVNLAAIDEKIRAPMEIKRVLFDNACSAARIVGLYRWLIGDALRMKLLHGATIPREGIQSVPLSLRYFPPRSFYSIESNDIVKELDRAMAQRDFRYEIVYEIFSKSETLECKMAIHIHKRNLQAKSDFLAPL